MTNILISDLNKSLKSLLGKTVQVKASSPALFIFFGGDSETCEANFYTMEEWEIFQESKLILKKDNQNALKEKEISEVLSNHKLIDIVVTEKSMELKLHENILIKIHNTGDLRTWEIRLKKDELFYTASGSGEFTKAIYKNSQII